MSNKRTKFTLDPVRINNYNKFLTTLDNKQESKMEEIKQTINDEESIKKEIDKIIHTINTKFNINNMSSPSFTGQTQNDRSLFYAEPNDPNAYIDFLNKNLNLKVNIRHLIWHNLLHKLKYCTYYCCHTCAENMSFWRAKFTISFENFHNVYFSRFVTRFKLTIVFQ